MTGTTMSGMRELLHLVEEPRACSYLPEQSASLEYRIVQNVTAKEYERLLERGYRRFGRQLFRPQCLACSRCVSVRFCASEFTPNAGLRRVLKRNRHIEVRHGRATMSPRHLELYGRYHDFMAENRGWTLDAISGADYYESFLAGGDQFGSEWLYYDGGELVGVALMDETPNAISLVYFFYEPAWRAFSPGTFSILVQLNYARERGKAYAYPGYWIAENSSMAYKDRFRPFEILAGRPTDAEAAQWTPHQAL
ncbi:MAG: arginyltransferase [Acidobacteria bacterium]|nr:arginyltransferase [Acidobacteriota bacterium]